MKPFSLKSCLSSGRVRSGLYWSTDEDGNQGKLLVRSKSTNPLLCILASDGRDWAETGMALPAWEHVSVSPKLCSVLLDSGSGGGGVF